VAKFELLFSPGFLGKLLSTALFVSPALGWSKAACRSYQSEIRQRKVKYCIDFTKAGSDQTLSNIPVVYFMHGAMGGNEQYSWIGYEKALKKFDESGKSPALAIISFSTSGLSFFTDWANNKDQHAYETWFLEEFVPMIEQSHPRFCRSRDCRGLMGVSMGGFGALKTAFRHPDLFGFVAATNPAILPFNIFEENARWDDYWRYSAFGILFGRYYIGRLRRIFQSPEYYNENDPVKLAGELNLAGPVPKLYFDIAGKDEFAFDVGHMVFRKELDRLKIPYQTKFFPVAHHILPHQPQSEEAVRFILEQIQSN